jgi:NTE family protein
MQVIEADGVFQAGGVKALALGGALLGFAERGVGRWARVAGAGSGALVAAYLACGRDPYDTEQRLRSAPYPRFADHGPGGRVLGGAWNLIRRAGLARSDYVRSWLAEQFGGRTFGSLPSDGVSRLKLLAADVTRRQALILPDDLPKYRSPAGGPIDADSFPIAEAVWLSMSVPYFFEPGVLVHHETGHASAIVGGGLVPAPDWIFDSAQQDARRPTFAIRVAENPRAAQRGRRRRFAADILQMALEAWDARVASPSSGSRTCVVSVGEIDATDFGLTPLEQTELVERGRRAARRFLDSFDLEEYANAYGRRLAAGVHAY